MKARSVLHLLLAAAAAAVLLVIGTSTNARRRPTHQAAYVRAGALNIRYVRAGRGAIIVLIHGYGESLMAWAGVFDRLALHYDVVALDLPGFGLSSKPATGYATDSLARAVLRAMDGMGITRASLAGHSLGGAVAAAATLIDSARVTALVLVDPATVGVPAPVAELQNNPGGSPATAAAIAEYEALRTRFSAPHDPQWMVESDSAMAYAPADDPAYRTAVSAALREFDFEYLTPDRTRRLAVPCLVLWGEYDEVFPLAIGRSFAARLPNSTFEVIARAWHRPHVERPAETADAIEHFLSGRTH